MFLLEEYFNATSIRGRIGRMQSFGTLETSVCCGQLQYKSFAVYRFMNWGNQLLEMFETLLNGLSGLENGWIGTKMSILALLV